MQDDAECRGDLCQPGERVKLKLSAPVVESDFGLKGICRNHLCIFKWIEFFDLFGRKSGNCFYFIREEGHRSAGQLNPRRGRINLSFALCLRDIRRSIGIKIAKV